MTEFLPIKNRSMILMINSGFYNFGNLFIILLNYYYINHGDKFLISSEWRIVNFITSLPGLLAFSIILIFQKESPLYLLNSDRDNYAFNILEQIGGALDDKQRQQIKEDITKKKNYRLNSNYSELFLAEFRWLTGSCLIMCSLFYFNMIGISYLVTRSIDILGDTNTYRLSYYSQLVIYAFLQLPNGFIGGWMTESPFIGRKKTILICSIFCGMFYFISFVHPIYICFYAGPIMLFNSIAFGCGYIYITEAFPTNLRDHAQSLIQFFAFLFGSWSPYIVDFFSRFNNYNNSSSILINFLVFGLSCFLCALVGFLLPIETFHRPLDEDVEMSSI